MKKATLQTIIEVVRVILAAIAGYLGGGMA